MLWMDKILQTIWDTYYGNEKGSKILTNWVALYILHQISGILTIKSLHWTSNPTKGNVIVGIHHFFSVFISFIGILPWIDMFQYLKLQDWPSNFTLDYRETSNEGHIGMTTFPLTEGHEWFPNRTEVSGTSRDATSIRCFNLNLK